MLPVRRLLLREQALTFGAVIAVLAALTWVGVGRAIDHQVQARSQENLLRLSRDVLAYLHEGERLGDTTANYLQLGLVSMDRPVAAEQLLRPLLVQFPSVSSLAVLDSDGRGLWIKRRNEHLSAWVLTKGERGVIARPLVGGWISALPESDEVQDALSPSWIQCLREVPTPRWIEQEHRCGLHEAAFVVPIKEPSTVHPSGSFVAVNMTLEPLARKVWDTRPTPGSLALICDGQRRALLVPMDQPLSQRARPGEAELKPIGPDHLPLFGHLLNQWEVKGHARDLFRLWRNGQTYSGRVLRLPELDGLDWRLCVVVPDRDYMGPLYRLAWILFATGGVFLGLILWRIQKFSRRLGDPLDGLAHSAAALGEGRLAEPVESNLAEIRAVDEALRKAGKALKNESEMKLKLEHSQRLETVGTLAGGIAHDVNNQLAAVLGQISLAAELLPEDHGAAYRIHRAEQAVERCSQMIKSLLSFTHRVKPELRVLDLNDLVSQTASLLERILGGLIRMELIQSPCLPPILGERVQLEQVILNLAVNARDAMPQGGKLTLRTLPVGEDQVCLSVEDTGFGIPKENLDRVFDPFFTTKDVGKGTGLGLAMVFGIVQSHDARIEMDSQEGVGTRFRVFFKAQGGWAIEEQETLIIDPSVHSFAGLRILVADDEPNLRELIAEAFEQRGAQVEMAVDGDMAWKKFKRQAEQQPFDLVVSDQRMPECTGLELLARIRESGAKTPMILASGFGLEGLDGELARDPNLRFLSKPCMIRDFFKVAKELLNLDPA